MKNFKIQSKVHNRVIMASYFPKEVGATGSILQLDSCQKQVSRLSKMTESGKRQIRGHHCHLLAPGCGAGHIPN